MDRTIFTAEHELYRASVRGFVARHITPFHADWERAGIVPRELWLEAGRQGLLGTNVPTAYGGAGVADFRYNVVFDEEMVRVGAHGPGFTLHNDVALPYLLTLATDEARDRWLPGCVSGELITAIAMTEPGAGSDLAAVRTTAVRDGDEYLVNGSKTFITNGINSDIVIVVTTTDPAAAHRGITLLVVERGMPGFTRGRKLDKIGMPAQDTAELNFTDVRVPVGNRLGEEGTGFAALMANLPQERLSIAVVAVAAAEAVLAETLAYCRERTAFGRPIGAFQHNRFVLAEMATEVAIARVFVDRAVAEHVAGRLSVAEAAMAKWWTTELGKRVVDACLQLHGGYGYMREFPVARAFLDTRVQTIYGGTTEIMKEIIGRSLGV